MPIRSHTKALLLAVAVLASACTTNPFAPSGEALPVNPYGFNYSTVQIIPPATPEGKACSQTCLQTLAECQNRCQVTAAACQQTGGSKCTTTQCDADCTLSYRACHIKCGGQVVVKPARSKQ